MAAPTCSSRLQTRARSLQGRLDRVKNPSAPVAAGRLFPAAMRTRRGQLINALEERLFQARLRPKQVAALDDLERTSLDAQVSSDRIRQVSTRGANRTSYPAGQSASSLKRVACWISGGMGTRVY